MKRSIRYLALENEKYANEFIERFSRKSPKSCKKENKTKKKIRNLESKLKELELKNTLLSLQNKKIKILESKLKESVLKNNLLSSQNKNLKIQIKHFESVYASSSNIYSYLLMRMRCNV